MFRKLLLITVLILISYLSACAVGKVATRRNIEQFRGIDSMIVKFHFDKVCYNHLNRTFFCLNRDENTIYIYRKQLINTIGKSGFGNDNFRQVTDISVGVDGYLYALDSFDQSIKKFDSEGKFIGRAGISNVSSPQRFAITQYGGFYVYDGHSREIVVLDPYDYTIRHSFGKFQIETVDNISIAGDYVNI